MPPQTPEQSQGITNVLAKLKEPLRAAKLTALSAIYRDMHLTALSMQGRMAGSPNPLLDEAGSMVSSTGRSAGGSGSGAGTSYPLLDTTRLPDTEVPSGMALDQRYMDKIACWSALQPSHMETSSMLLTGINLFPPQEATYPTYVDFDAVVKSLEQRKSRMRIKLLRGLRRKQDKYQLKVWDHAPGHQ